MVLDKKPTRSLIAAPLHIQQESTTKTKLEIIGFEFKISGYGVGDPFLQFSIICKEGYNLPNRIHISVEEFGVSIVSKSVYTAKTVNSRDPYKNTFLTSKLLLTPDEHAKIFGNTKLTLVFSCEGRPEIESVVF